MALTQSLEKLVHVLEKKGIPMRQRLQPGLTKADVQAALAPLGLTPPEELYELYEWRDGVADWDTPSPMLFGETHFLPLKDAIAEYQDFRQYFVGEDFEDLSIDLDKCFPFAFFMGYRSTIYCDPTLVLGFQHPVIGIYHDFAVSFENIERMAQTATEWFVAGVYDKNPVDDELKWAIRQKLNPRIPDPNPGL